MNRVPHLLTEAGLAALGDHTPAVLRRIADGLRCGRVDPDTGEVDEEIALTLVNAIAFATLLDCAASTWARMPAELRDAVRQIAALGPVGEVAS